MDEKENRNNNKHIIEPEIISHSNAQEREAGRGNYYSENTRIYSLNRISSTGCLSPCVTLIIFLVIVSQYGLLAGICFIFFYICGSIAGSIYMARCLMRGIIINPWVPRGINWILSYLITAWLALGTA